MVLNGGRDQWVTGLGVLVHPGDSGMKPGLEEQGHTVQRHEVLPHSPRGQPGLPEKGKAWVCGMIVAVGFYCDLRFYGRLPVPWSGA